MPNEINVFQYGVTQLATTTTPVTLQNICNQYNAI